jgi:hypothetical protein
MVAINSQTQVPTGITTLESFVVWSAVALGDLDTSQITFLREDLSGNEFKTSVKAVKYLPVTDTFNKKFMQIVAYIPLTDTVFTEKKLVWESTTALPLQASSIPAVYLKV